MLKARCLLLAVVCGPQLASYHPTAGASVGADGEVPAAGHPSSSSSSSEEGEVWTYEAQQLWPRLFEACGGPRQSPIRLDVQAVELGGRPRVTFSPGLADGRVRATNTGHTLQLRLSTETGVDAGTAVDTDADTDGVSGTGAVSGGRPAAPLVTLSSTHSPLSGTYHLEQLHFHWGDSEGRPGSEHLLDGRLADAEAHFVFFNARYGSIGAAAQRSDGLAVLGVLLQGPGSGQRPGQLTWPPLGLQGRLGQLAEVGSELTVSADLTPLRPLLLQAVGRVFSYRGSLTTPPCSPVVSWLVAARPVAVPGPFLEELRSSQYRDAAGRRLLQNNRRRLQLRMDRLVIERISFD